VNQGVSSGLLEGRNVIISFRSGDCLLQIWNRLGKSPFGLSPDHTTEEQQVHCWCMILPGIRCMISFVCSQLLCSFSCLVSLKMLAQQLIRNS
jgi:hypothetical protein